jgi:DNA-binding NarL/FixJ family response regulator
LLIDSSPQELLKVVYDVHRGEAPASEHRHPVDSGNQPSLGFAPVENPLSERELEVRKLVAQGLKNQEIAARLVRSELTIRTHVRNILGKLHLAKRTQSALFVLRESLAELENN